MKLYVMLNAFFYVAFFVIAPISLWQVLRNKGYGATMADAILLALIVIAIVNDIFFQKNNYGSPQLYIDLSMGVLYFLFSFLLQNRERNTSIIFWVVVIGAGIESMLAYAQNFGLITNASSLFLFGGSFGNPGALAVYLSIVSPFILVVLLYHKDLQLSENSYYFFLACFISCISWVLFSNSRGAWVACTFGCFVVANQKYELLKKVHNVFQNRILKISIVITTLTLFTASGYFLYNYKKDSAFGRLLIWKIAVKETPYNTILFGAGAGAFEANYGKWQAHYFATAKAIPQEKTVADYVTSAYNEYLEILINNGTIVLILFAIVITMALKRKTTNHINALAAKASIAAILIAAFVSYPFSLMPVLLHLSLCLAIIFHFTDDENNKRVVQLRPVTAWLLLLPLMSYCFIYGIYYTNSFYHLKKGLQFVLTKKTDDGIAEYEKANKVLQNNGTFLFYYGSAMAAKGNHSESITLLEKAITKESDPNGYILLGNEYKAIKQYTKSEAAYTIAANMIPSRLYAKYLLAKLYIVMNEHGKAIKLANEIMQMNDKVHTTAADEIRHEMNELLKKYNNL